MAALMVAAVAAAAAVTAPSSTAPTTTTTTDCYVTQHGAKGDGQTEDTAAFAATITACTQGGLQRRGSVIVPPGTYILRPTRLLSYTELVIQPGATLLAWSGVGWLGGGAPPPPGWPNSTAQTCGGDGHVLAEPFPALESLLYGDAVHDVTIRGGGAIHGNGSLWWPLRQKSDYWHHCRPSLIRIGVSHGVLDSSGVVIDDVALHDSPRFNIHANVRHARLTRLNITADVGCPEGSKFNNDGINIKGHDIYISDCNIHNSDDCIPIGANASDVLVERVRCACGSGATIVVWGSSEPANYIRNVTFRDMSFNRTSKSGNIKSVDLYQGMVEDITFENFLLEDVGKAILINENGQNTAAQSDRVGGGRGGIRVLNITFRNFSGTAQHAGDFNCNKAGGGCTGINVVNVRVTGGQGNSSITPYTCNHVSGTVTDCSPQLCFGD